MLHVDDSNIFDWQIAIFGPPGTAYAGGYFKVRFYFYQLHMGSKLVVPVSDNIPNFQNEFS